MQPSGICQEIRLKMARMSYVGARTTFETNAWITYCTTSQAQAQNGVLWLGMRFLLVFSLLLLPIVSATPQAVPPSADDYSGMYTFLREGEFLQVTIEEQSKVSGFISRFGDSETDKNEFLDQFFESGKLDSGHLTFTTKNVHGTWFTFDGTVERGVGKKPEEEGYYVIRGTLNRFRSDADKKNTTQDSRRVEFKSFPRDVTP
jgi:hypothetical protein